jgi:thermitase
LPDAALARILKENGGGKARRIGKSELRIVDLPAGREKAMVERLARHPHVKFAELDQLVPPNLAVNDPYFGSAWHLAKIGAPAAWDVGSGAGVTVAILDTGVDASHPDLANRMVAGWNWFDNNSDTRDVYGHGTLVAGAAAASSNNSIGVAGLAGQARIMPIRVSDLSGYASWSALSQGLIWAADRGARVANISYVVANSASTISAANYMKSKGGLVLTSAGNYGTDANITPTTSMIPVSATGAGDTKASWSSFGGFVAISAPGEGIYTTIKGGGYGAANGTSFSSPVTAGVVALMMSANPTLPAADVEKLLFSTAVDLGATGRDVYYGHGRVNAAAAVAAAVQAQPTGDKVAPAASITAPLGSSTVGGLVAVNVTASDNVGVTRVELRANNALVATDTSSPFGFSWDSATTPNGMNNLTAVAYDAAGNATTSSAVAVNVSNSIGTAPPTVAITNPTGGAKVSGTVAVRVTASDDAGPAALKQALYINDRLVAQATGGALSYSWNTRKASGSSFVIKAVVTDAAMNSTTQSVQVTK